MTIRVEDHGSIWLLVPDGDAKTWLDENASIEAWQWFSGGFAAEPRCVTALLDGFREDGGEVVSLR